MPPPFPDAHAQGEWPVSQAPRRRTARHRSGSSPAHQRQGTEPPRLPRLDGCSALEPTHRNEKHLLGSKSKLLPSQITSISHLLLPSGDYLSRLPKQLRTPLRAELTRPNSKRVPPFLFARLTTDRLCTSLSASSRRCLLQEWRSYIVGSMFCHSPLGSLCVCSLSRGAGAPTVRKDHSSQIEVFPNTNASSRGLSASAQQPGRSETEPHE